MTSLHKTAAAAASAILLAGLAFRGAAAPRASEGKGSLPVESIVTHHALKFDVSPPLASIRAAGGASAQATQTTASAPQAPPVITAAGAAVEQTAEGDRPAIDAADSFDGLGVGFPGPPGRRGFARGSGNPSDNSLAVGPNDIVQIVNSQFAVYSKKGARYPETGKVLYGPTPTTAFFNGFGGPCAGPFPSGDAVVRYDQLARRWLVVVPIFRPIPPEQPAAGATAAPQSGVGGTPAQPGTPSVPGAAAGLPASMPGGFQRPQGTYGMCYAVSTSSDPLGTYYRYAFARKDFPDYPRPAVWPDGWYVATSKGDQLAENPTLERQICVVDRAKMLAGQPATEQCIAINGVNFLNPADIDGQALPPPGSPEIVMANGGTQLKNIFSSDAIQYWKVHVDWQTPSQTSLAGPFEISVAPYNYLCNGQLTECVPQPGTDTRLDSQGDKLMQRLVYRRIGNHQWIVASDSVDTKAGGGGVRWYEFELNKQFDPQLYQQGTYAPDANYRWMPSMDIDHVGDIGVGYSFGGPQEFVGQRFAARKANDPKGQLTFHETVLAAGEAVQTGGTRWEDYTTTAMDPSDDCTFWYVGDYFKKDATHYSTRIGAFRVPGCK